MNSRYWSHGIGCNLDNSPPFVVTLHIYIYRFKELVIVLAWLVAMVRQLLLGRGFGIRVIDISHN
jgi:hypothetical protein